MKIKSTKEDTVHESEDWMPVWSLHSVQPQVRIVLLDQLDVYVYYVATCQKKIKNHQGLWKTGFWSVFLLLQNTEDLNWKNKYIHLTSTSEVVCASFDLNRTLIAKYQ